MTCDWCGKALPPKHTRWCDNRCRARYRMDRDPESFRQANRAYRQRHPDRAREACRRWREANRERSRIIARASNAKRKEATAAWNAANRDRRRARVRERYALNPIPFRLAAMKHHLQKKGAKQGPIDPDFIVLRDGGRCGICGKKVAAKDRSFDHIIPVADGGPNTQDNLQLSHLICNLRRGRGRIAAQLRLPI